MFQITSPMIPSNVMNRSIPAGFAMAAAVAASVATAAPASAFVVNVGGQDYDVKSVFSTFEANATLLQSQVWWGDGSLAQQFAAAVGTNLGGFSNGGFSGPLFSVQLGAGDTNEGFSYQPADFPLAGLPEGVRNYGTPNSTFGGVTWQWNYAYAERVSPSSVPGPLPLLGAAAAFGWSRRLRKRLSAG